jgi:hypothetical protein
MNVMSFISSLFDKTHGEESQSSLAYLALLARQISVRRALKHQYAKDEAGLDRLGVIKEEVDWALSLPLHIDASRALAEQAALRRAEIDRQRARGCYLPRNLSWVPLLRNDLPRLDAGSFLSDQL